MPGRANGTAVKRKIRARFSERSELPRGVVYAATVAVLKAHSSGTQRHRKFRKANAKKWSARSLACDKLELMIKTPATIAKQIECSMRRAAKDCFLYQNEHCAVFEKDLAHICPRNDKDRKKKLAQFAAQYGFRLKFYHNGLFAIFGKRAPPVANDVGGFWPSGVCSASPAK